MTLQMGVEAEKSSQVVLVVKNPPARTSPGRRCKRPEFNPWVGKIPWRRAWEPLSSILAGRIPWTEEPGGLQSTGLKRVKHMTLHAHAESLQSCPTFCDPVDCIPPRPLSMGFSRQEHWSRSPFPSPGIFATQ